MSSGGSQHVDTGALSQQIDAVSREATALADAFARARRTRQLLALVVLVLVVVICLVFYNLGRKLMSQENINALTQKAQERLNKNRDKYMDQVTTLVKSAGPALGDAFTAQAKKDMPAILDAVEKERQPLMDNLQKQLEKKLQAHYDHVLASYRSMLEQEFPAIKDSKQHDRMMANLKVAIDKLIQKYYVKEMNDQLVKLFDELDRFPSAEKPKKGDLPLEDQFTANLWQLFISKLTSKEGVSTP
jgi:hypothetical protein